MAINNENIDDTFRLPDEYYTGKLRIAEKLLLAKAIAGEIWAIQNLLQLVAEAIDAGFPLPKNIAAFISTALNKIHDGVNADEAFGIKRARGEKDTRKANQRQFAIAYFIEMADGTLEDKCELAAIKFSVSVHTAKTAWQKKYKLARRTISLESKYI